MNFATLKAGFLKYLKEEGIILSAKEKRELTSASIFAYQEEFREYLNKEHNIDIDSLSFEFSDLTNLDVKGGKISSSAKDDENLTMDIFNEMIEDEEFIGLLDGDEDKKLSDEEIQHFLKFASSNDGDEDNLSIDDLLKSYDKAKKGEYDKTEITKAKTTPTSSTGGTTGGGYNPGGNQNGTTKDKNDPNNVKNMSYDDLKSAKTQKQNDINAKRTELNQVYANDQHAVDEAKTAYDDAISKDNIDPQLKASRDANIEAIATQDKLITSLKSALNDLDGQISSKESELTSITSQKQALIQAQEAIKNFSMPSQAQGAEVVALAQDGAITPSAQPLVATQTTLTPEIQSEITTKQQGIASDLALIEQKETALTQEIADLKSQKTTKEGELNTAQGNLTTLETEKTTIDSQILETCSQETRDALEAYNKARDVAKTNAKTAEGNIKTAQEDLAKVETELNARDAKNIKNKYAISAGEMFDADSTLKWDYIEGETTLPYGVIAPEDVNPNEKLPVLIFLHGSGEVGSKGGLYNVATQNFIDTDLENFRGYIICPHLAGGGNWGNDKSMERIGEIITSFSQTHNIDENNIAMSGHSLGGIGAVYASRNNRFEQLTGIKISKTVILSGYTDRNVDSLDMDTKIYVGSSGDGAAKWEMHEYLVKTGAVSEEDYHVLQGSTHGSLDQDAFTLDDDNDGRSDVFEWLFDEDDYHNPNELSNL